MTEIVRVLSPDLSEPISDSSPCGRLLRTEEGVDSELRNILDLARSARTAERKAEDQGDDPSLVPTNDWRAVKEQAQQLLKESSKDLEATAMLIESLVRVDGFTGLAEGLELLAGLINRYWSEMLARARTSPDDDEEALIGSLVKPIEQLNIVLPVPIARIPLTSGGDAGDLALWQYDQGVQAARLTPEELEKRKVVTQDQFLRSVALTAESQPRFFIDLLAAVEGAMKATSLAEAALDARLPAGEAPGLAKLRERLDDVIRCLNHTASTHLFTPSGDPVGGNGAASGSGAAGAGGGELATREQAFRELLRIADFFARTEPLSLLAEQIRQVVHRGRLSPDKYYSELIDNEDTLKQFFRLVGIRASESGDSSS